MVPQWGGNSGGGSDEGFFPLFTNVIWLVMNDTMCINQYNRKRMTCSLSR